MPEDIRYIECPRDSWQGFSRMIPVAEKRRYLQRLLAAGFRHLDLASFVSPKAVPQMSDSEEVLAALPRLEDADFLGIIANEQGLKRALALPNLTAVGYPLSVNDSFQRRNTRLSLAESWPLLEALFTGAKKQGRRFVVYLSMGFGNPYGEPWSPEDTAAAVSRLRGLGISDIALADTVGTATAERIHSVLDAIGQTKGLGLHLHARTDAWLRPLEVGLEHGLRWFEGALAGIGGCPFADDHLVGNLPSEQVLPWLAKQGFNTGVTLTELPELAEQAALLKTKFE